MLIYLLYLLYNSSSKDSVNMQEIYLFQQNHSIHRPKGCGGLRSFLVVTSHQKGEY